MVLWISVCACASTLVATRPDNTLEFFSVIWGYVVKIFMKAYVLVNEDSNVKMSELIVGIKWDKDCIA